MPGIAVLQGPVPPPLYPLGFCAVCTAIAKATLFAADPDLTRRVQAHESGGSGTRAFPIDPPLPEPAVAWGILPQLKTKLPLCWAHFRLDAPTTLTLADGGAVHLDRR
jgi:hypothetical protein